MSGIVDATGLLQLPIEAQSILEITGAFAQDPNFGPIEAISALTPAELRIIQEGYEHLQRRGEQTIDWFVEELPLTWLRQGTAGLGRFHPESRLARSYEVTARCPEKQATYTVERHLTSSDLGQLRSLDFKLAHYLAQCPSCDESHDPIKSVMKYNFFDPRIAKGNRSLVDEYLRIHQEITTKLTRLRIPTEREAREEMIKNLEGYTHNSSMRGAIRRWQNTLDMIADLHTIIGIETRVKGSESFIYKVADVWLRLEETREELERRGLWKGGRRSHSRGATPVGDYLGIKLLVGSDDQFYRLLEKLHEETYLTDGPLTKDDEQVKDNWGPSWTVTTSNGKTTRGGRRQDAQGRITFEAWKGVFFYRGFPIEIQIQTPEMRNYESTTHRSYKEERMELRATAERHYPERCPYSTVIPVLNEMLRAA